MAYEITSFKVNGIEMVDRFALKRENNNIEVPDLLDLVEISERETKALMERLRNGKRDV